ncbi:MAG: alpha/beta hydrolase [Planctomycetaceae bacterium]|nr:alpha/beta hydrolase [Planctomycetaceae bacterium]
MLDVASDSTPETAASPSRSETAQGHAAPHEPCHVEETCSESTHAPGECCPPDQCSGEGKLDGAHQPCPTPQVWHQVLASFREQAESWSIDRNGRTITGRTIGSGPPIYFLNGIGGTHELFVLTAWLLRDEFRCVLFDSPPPDGRCDALNTHARAMSGSETIPPALRQLAEDLLAVADRHGDATFSISATSFGVAVALAAMALAPHRIERGALQGGFARLDLSFPERMLIRLGRWLPGRVRHLPLRSIIQTQSHLPWFPPFDLTRWQFFSDDTGQLPLRTLAGRASVLTRCDLTPLLPQIRTPLILIRGEGEGRVSAAASEQLHASLPEATVERMHGCGHLPYLTHPHRLVKLLRPFFKGEEVPQV